MSIFNNLLNMGNDRMNITIHVEHDNRERVLSEVENILTRISTEIGIHLEGEAKEELGNEPERIDTGRLRNSITYGIGGESPHVKTYKGDRVGKNGKPDTKPPGKYNGKLPKDKKYTSTIYVGTNCEYAIPVHEGQHSLRRVPANRFISNAFERNKEQIKQKIKEAFSRA